MAVGRTHKATDICYLHFLVAGSAIIPPRFQKLPVVRRCVRERVIEARAVRLRGVHKAVEIFLVEIFLDIDRFEEQAFVTNLVRVFDQNSSGAIDAPDPKSRPKKSAVRIKVVWPRHRMQTIDRDSILAIKAVICSITDSSFVEQLLPFHGKIKRLFLDLVGSPHADGIFVIHREFQCLIQPEISSGRDRTLVPSRHNKAANAFENAQVRISIKIMRQPAEEPELGDRSIIAKENGENAYRAPYYALSRNN
jgi:hypothetical protein